MTTQPSVFIGTRKSNGQIAYISEGIQIKSLVQLLQPRGDVKVIVDYAPMIEKLYEFHSKLADDAINKEYNSLYSYWQDSRTYTKLEIKILKSENLCTAANNLIAQLKVIINQKTNEISPRNEYYWISNQILHYSEIYIDTLLCFIHSKASIDVQSFKKDIILAEYCNFLLTSIHKALVNLLGIDKTEVLTYMALIKPAEFLSFSSVIQPGLTIDSFLSQLVKDKFQNKYKTDYNSNTETIPISFVNYRDDYIKSISSMRDLIFTAIAIRDFLAQLKENEIVWDDNADYNFSELFLPK